MYTINFLEHRQKKVSQLEKQDKKVFKIAVIGFSVAGALTLALLGAQLFWQQRVSSVIAYQKQLEKQVSDQEQTEQNYLFFVSKLDILHTLFRERKDKQAAINYFSQIFGPNVLIENITYDAQNGSILFGLKANDVFILENVFNLLASEQTNSQFSTVQKTDLRRLEDGTYALQVEVIFKTETNEKNRPKN